ncbi:MAG: hypothetical protein Q8O03_04330 [Nanoarchaeota archaeon]|nr:hypothetical protein [Nanoarchaeota archaeon]
MVFDPISRMLLDEINKKAKKEAKDEIKDGYRIRCPKCKRRVIREIFIKEGCFVCSFKPKEGDD